MFVRVVVLGCCFGGDVVRQVARGCSVAGMSGRVVDAKVAIVIDTHRTSALLIGHILFRSSPPPPPLLWATTQGGIPKSHFCPLSLTL